MPREIELQTLLQLTQRRPRARAGEVIVSEGDPSVAVFVVLSGTVELRKKGQNSSTVALGTVGPGEIFGFETLANLPAGTTAVAQEDVSLLVVDARSALEVLLRRPRFALGLAQSLCDRIALLERQTASGAVVAAAAPSTPAVGQRMVIQRPSLTPRAAPSATVTPPSVPRVAAAGAAVANDNAAPMGVAPERVAPELPKEYWTKEVTCPICAAQFDAVHLRSEAVRLKKRDSDFCEHYHAHNPLFYAIYACPECFYAAYPDDFGTLSPKEAVDVGSALAELPDGGELKADFSGLRDHKGAMASFSLAVLAYQARAVESRKLAGLFHRLAWLARQAEDAAAEQQYLAQARDAYRAALDQRPPLEERAEAMAMYLLADICLRVGDRSDAVKWLESASQHPALDKGLTSAVQELRQTVRERSRA